MFFTYSAHQTTYENLLKTRLILEMKFDFEIEIFQGQGCLREFFLLFFSYSAREITYKYCAWTFIKVLNQT